MHEAEVAMMLNAARIWIQREMERLDAIHEGRMFIRVRLTPPGANAQEPPFVVECDEGCHFWMLLPRRRPYPPF